MSVSDDSDNEEEEGFDDCLLRRLEGAASLRSAHKSAHIFGFS
jgi:hypothetical protein